MRVKPVDPNAIIRDPHTKLALPAEGGEVPDDHIFWTRRLIAGEVVRIDDASRRAVTSPMPFLGQAARINGILEPQAEVARRNAERSQLNEQVARANNPDGVTPPYGARLDEPTESVDQVVRETGVHVEADRMERINPVHPDGDEPIKPLTTRTTRSPR